MKTSIKQTKASPHKRDGEPVAQLSVFCYDVPSSKGTNGNANVATGPVAVAAAAALYAESYYHVAVGVSAFIGMGGTRVNSALGPEALVDNGASANKTVGFYACSHSAAKLIKILDDIEQEKKHENIN